MNTDAAIFSQSKSVGIGVVIRDHEGLVIAAMSKHLPLPLGPLEVEAKAMDEAVLFAWIFEDDSCIVSYALFGSDCPASFIVNIISNTPTKGCRSLDLFRLRMQST